MADDISKVDIAFLDLGNALTELNNCKGSPVEVRRNFSAFINLSQKITSYMRTDYSEKTNGRWDAKEFGGWNDVTELFKKLRTIEEHDGPIILRLYYTWYFEGLGPDGSLKMAMKGYWEWDNPLDEFPSDKLKAFDRNPEDDDAVEIKPKKVEYIYILYDHEKDVMEMLDRIGFADIHKLSKSCLETLSSYVQFYNEKVSENS